MDQLRPDIDIVFFPLLFPELLIENRQRNVGNDAEVHLGLETKALKQGLEGLLLHADVVGNVLKRLEAGEGLGWGGSSTQMI